MKKHLFVDLQFVIICAVPLRHTSAAVSVFNVSTAKHSKHLKDEHSGRRAKRIPTRRLVRWESIFQQALTDNKRPTYLAKDFNVTTFFLQINWL